jgi:hypothetical protein
LIPPAAVATVLADSDAGKGSPIGLLIVLLLIVAVYFLYRSMNRHLRKVPPQFDQRQPSGADPQPPAADSKPPVAGLQPPTVNIQPPPAESASAEPARPERPEQDG